MLLCNSVDDPTQNKTKLVQEIIPDSLRLGDLSNAPRPLQMIIIKQQKVKQNNYYYFY